MDVFLHENGLKPAGPMREIYLTDPGDVPNPDEWKTQLIWPVAPPPQSPPTASRPRQWAPCTTRGRRPVELLP